MNEPTYIGRGLFVEAIDVPSILGDRTDVVLIAHAWRGPPDGRIVLEPDVAIRLVEYLMQHVPEVEEMM